MVLAVSYALKAHSRLSKAISPSKSDVYDATSEEWMDCASPSQIRLAEIVEMIHTASLFHDDVIDKVRSKSFALSTCQFSHSTIDLSYFRPQLEEIHLLSIKCLETN